MFLFCRFLLLSAFLSWPTISPIAICFAGDSVQPLLPDSDRPPVPVDHFPDPLHAVVFRNWGLVRVERLAQVLQTTPANVTAMATSMGLPETVQVPPEMLTRGYITLVRRNWHLLPYAQLLMLLGLSPEEFSRRLQEDDFLWVKLGLVKPNCPAVVYHEPSAAAKARAAEIKSLVYAHFGKLLQEPAEPRFDFIRKLSELPAQAEVTPSRNGSTSSEKLRFVYSYFAMFGDPLIDPALDPFPDGLLARLRDCGVNGVWLHIVLRELAPPTDTFPQFGQGHQQRLDNLKRLVQRASRYGIKIYLYLNEPRSMPESFFERRSQMRGVPDTESPTPHFALCTSSPEVRQWIQDSLTHIFTEVPDLGGVFTITASENLTNCSSKFTRSMCPHCKDRSDSDILVEINRTIADGVHRAAPQAKVIAWDWGWAKHGDASETIARLPQDVWLMSVSEWDVVINRGGVAATVGEYSITAVGPGPRAIRHWQVAQQHGLKTAAKMQLNVTWELAAVPYIPAMRLVAQHNANLAQLHLDGQMLSWSLGGYPSANLELASYFDDDPDLTVDGALERLAKNTYGDAAVDEVLKAWQLFSNAYSEYPYAGMYSGPQHVGPANLLYQNATGYQPSMVCFPYDGLNAWCGPFPPGVYAAQFQKVASGFAEGLEHLESAAALAPPEKQAYVTEDMSVARAAWSHFQTVANQVRYLIARDRLKQTSSPPERAQLTIEIQQLLEDEIAAAVSLYPTVAADSRIGYEASNHYFYVPQDLIEKVINCEHLKHCFAD